MGTACYVGVLLVLLLLENSLLFHPLQATQGWLAPPNALVQDVDLVAADGGRLHAWWCPTPGWDPSQGAMLYCHGNAANLSHRAEPIAQWQRAMDMAVLIFDYPGYGRCEGKPCEAGCYAAAAAAYDWLTQTKHVPPERVVLYGVSLGGGVAVDLAVRRPHRALVLLSAFTSVPDMAQKLYPWLPGRWLVRNRFDNLAKIGDCTRPVLIAHGTADGLIPFTQGERLFAAANEPKQFVRLEGHGHNDLPSPEFYAALRRFLAETDARTPPAATAAK
jgi:fermentation-respiration switch protein FrsA (DUF1100 family)